MIEFDQWVLPDGETHLQWWMSKVHDRRDGRLRYQGGKYDWAMKFVRQRRVAIDVGAHVGLWSYWMSKDFATLHAFEPKAEHRACWEVNMQGRTNATVHQFALGHERRQVGLFTGPSSSGDTQVRLDQDDVPMTTLDSFGFTDVDFVKIDCEGFEAFVIEGATETLTRCRPILIVEQKPGHGQRFGRGEIDAVRLLEGLGYYCCREEAGDYVMRPLEHQRA